MERINIRLLGTPASVDAAIPEFHRWIQQNATGEMLIDVVDYRHVPDGPGVVLIGHDGDYGLSTAGLTYSRKTKSAGSDVEKILDAYNRAAEAGRRFGLAWREFEVIVNDRIGTPNTDENWHALQALLTDAFGLEVTRRGEPRSRLTARVTAKTNLVDLRPRQTAAAH